jgi:threonylcarbamoyladenosine tRNA methylthiotransferase MtaB
MPHLHLSLQAGHDLTLKRMKRRHLREDALRFCEEARRLRPELTLGADLIAGFPTETDAMFDGTLGLVEDCGLTWLHVFPFSPRRGTPAAKMPQVPGAVIRERAARLREVGDVAARRHLEAQVGRRHRVLLESPRLGRTEQFAMVAFAEDRLVGTIVEEEIRGTLHGQLVA